MAWKFLDGLISTGSSVRGHPILRHSRGFSFFTSFCSSSHMFVCVPCPSGLGLAPGIPGHAPGLRCVAGLVYFYGPCPAATGEITMLRGSGIFGLLPPGRILLCDGGFRGEVAHMVTPFRQIGLTEERRVLNKRVSAQMWRIEATFSRMINWKPLCGHFRHSLQRDHWIVWTNIAQPERHESPNPAAQRGPARRGFVRAPLEDAFQDAGHYSGPVGQRPNLGAHHASQPRCIHSLTRDVGRN